jgi:1-acyl-sn-glycerol-3-phosphate acyltransferase
MGPLIVAANHLHSFDAFLLSAFLPRKIMFLTRASAYRFPPVGWFLRMCGAFPITRGQADQWSLNWSLEVLKQGKVLGIFPEGRVQHGSGMAVAKTGVALLACKAGAPILPMSITGTELLRHWPKGGRFAMGLRAGSVLEVEKVSEPNPEQLRLITDELMFRIARLLPPSYQGVYRL